MGLKLVLKANLEGLTDLRPIDTAESPFEYTFEIACISCRETHDKFVTINRFEQHEMDRSKGEANFGLFEAKGAESTTKFSEIEIDEGEYYDYDDNKGSEVSITEASWDIVKG
ncbi:hypothetical protein BN7_6611 [Wickerhamomyces ciferrii]|uniref:Uncharacterized protein n=1 Tax=Wickerhamomyces ciferrii (strain ATCC 14091 / BCRC 22168 / CBS 111 / JCM 3599 / NBRC 0793 / NRRL Y-1031 F-60-10) TaxID=1206466 RepID=K0L0N1_WICCF|nr:uncharacterized protein BN7_6611 [Wickerhamomyces ciferrii]CCH47003.1 hypothetical protein BN7_6611 [Wickerhamomyces ciferrii]